MPSAMEPGDGSAGLDQSAPAKGSKKRCKPVANLTGVPALEQQLKDLTLELQAARSEGEAHQALHSAMTALERYQQDLLRAGERAGVLSKRTELQPEASQPAPGFFVSFVGKVQSVASRLKQNVTLALIKGGFYSPTDEDLRSFIVTADPQELHRRNAAHRELLPSLLLQWENCSEAGAREQIEARMKNFLDLRARFLRGFMRHRPEMLPGVLSIRNLTPPPEECSAEERGTCSSLLHPSLAAVEQMEWTEEQREALRPAWETYCRTTAAIRQRASTQLDAMTTSAALQSLHAWEAADDKSLGPLMGAYAELADTVGGCEAWMRLEVLAITELVCWCMETMSPTIQVKLSIIARPYILDVTQVCRWLLSTPPAGGSDALST